MEHLGYTGLEFEAEYHFEVHESYGQATAELIVDVSVVIGIRLFANSGRLPLECLLNLVCYVVEVDSNGLLTHELDALDPDLRVFRLELSRVWCPLGNGDFIDAALLRRLVNLHRYDLLQ